MNALTHAFSPPPAQEFDAVGDSGPAVWMMLKSLQSRVDAQQLRIAGLETRVAALDASVQITRTAPADLVPFERRLFPWVGRLAQAVADEWGVSAAELIGKSRQSLLIRPRFVLDWTVKQAASDYALAQIGRLLGRDHTTIIYSIRRVNEWRKAEETFRHVTDHLVKIGQRLRAEQLESLRARQDELIAEAGAEGGAE